MRVMWVSSLIALCLILNLWFIYIGKQKNTECSEDVIHHKSCSWITFNTTGKQLRRKHWEHKHLIFLKDKYNKACSLRAIASKLISDHSQKSRWRRVYVIENEYWNCFRYSEYINILTTHESLFTGRRITAYVKKSSIKPLFLSPGEAACNLINCLQWWSCIVGNLAPDLKATGRDNFITLLD